MHCPVACVSYLRGWDACRPSVLELEQCGAAVSPQDVAENRAEFSYLHKATERSAFGDLP